MKKRLLCLLLAASMLAAGLAGCSGDDNQSVPTNGNNSQSDNQTPGDEEQPSDGEDQADPSQPTALPTDDQGIYDANFSEFYDYYMQAFEADSVSQRYALMAIAEAKLLESGVMFPLTTRGGNYAMSRIAPYTASTVMWGNDTERYHNYVVTTDFIKVADRDEIKAKWAELAGTGEFEQWTKDFLTGKGYTLKDELNISYSSDPNNWDVLATYYESDSVVLTKTYDGLVEYDMENVMQPALAESWEVSEDGLTYTFHLRETNWVDSQGRVIAPVVADDFVAGLQHLLDAKGGLEYLTSGIIVNADEYMTGAVTDFNEVGVKAVDEHTLQYTLCQETPYFLTMLGYGIFAPLSRTYYESRGGKFGADFNAADATYTYGQGPDSIAYCGPYLVTNATEKNTIAFKANPSYWNADGINLKAITWLYNDGSDEAKYYNDAKEGVTDSCTLTTARAEMARNDALFDDYAYVSSTNATSFIGFYNLNRQAFANYNDANVAVSTQSEEEAARTHVAVNNQNFRLALAFGLDRGAWNAQSVGETLKYNSLRNSYVPGHFVQLDEDINVDINGTSTPFAAGTYYGVIVQAQLDADGVPIKVWDPEANGGIGSGDGFDGYYNPDNAKAYMAKAVEELKQYGVEVSAENPIQIDLPYNENAESYNNRAQALKKSIEESLDGLVQINLVAVSDFTQWQDAVYYYGKGAEGNFDLNDYTGWGPDFGDPCTYLDTLLPGGDGSMSKNFGLW